MSGPRCQAWPATPGDARLARMNVNAKLGHTPIKILVIDDPEVVLMVICILLALTLAV